MNTLVLALPLVPGAGAVLVYAVARLVTRRNGVLAATTACILAAGLAIAAAVMQHVLTFGPLGWLTVDA